MKADVRREKILSHLEKAEAPISATALSEKLKVSRQIIVGDVAILRAAGHDIIATPRGYALTEVDEDFNYIGTVAVDHQNDRLQEELYTIVDYGGSVIDVTVEHSVYGQLSGKLEISSRYDADNFCQRLIDENVHPLSDLTHGIHLHRIGCNSEQNFAIIREQLDKKGFLLSREPDWE